MCLPGQSFQQQFVGEQLAYIAALTVGAALVFGDRPKEETYQRLMSLPSLSDLDKTFGAQVRSPSIASLMQSREPKPLPFNVLLIHRIMPPLSPPIPEVILNGLLPDILLTAVGVQAALNYEESLSGQPAVAQRAEHTLAQHIMQTEREAVLCQYLHKAAGSHAASQRFARPLVVGVVGEAHLEGIAGLWQDGKWQEALASAQQGAKPCKRCPKCPTSLLGDGSCQC